MIAEQGLPAFIDALIDSPEYLETFGEDLVPYQRARVLAGQAVGAMRWPAVQNAWRWFVATGGFVLTGFVIWTAIAMLSTGAQG